MVEVGDKVFVAPLYGQKDNLAVISAGGGGGLTEGDYNTWTKKWINEPDNKLSSAYDITIAIDEKNERLSIFYADAAWDYRFAIYNLSDFSAVYESPRGSDYLYEIPSVGNASFTHRGIVSFYYGGISESLQTYLLFLRQDQDTIEVWQSGASALWSTNTQTDFGSASTCNSGLISLTGKYILTIMRESSAPNDYYLMLYEGSKV